MLIQLRGNQWLKHIVNGNSIWFLALTVVCLSLLCYTLIKKRDIKLFILYLGLSAIASLFEDVVFVGLYGYEYYPKLLSNHYYDMTLGAYLSQILFVSSAAVFIVGFQLSFRWSLLFTGLFVGIEMLFIVIGIYKENWWNPVYTGIGLIVFFFISNKWYVALKQGESPLIRYVTLVCVGYILPGNLIVIPLLADHYHFVAGWFEEKARDTLMVVIVYLIAKGGLAATAVFFRIHWTFYAAFPIAMLASYLVLIELHRFTFNHLWDIYWLSIIDIGVPLGCLYFYRRMPAAKRIRSQ